MNICVGDRFWERSVAWSSHMYRRKIYNLLAGSSTQTRCVEYFISRDIIGEEAGTTSFKYMIRYARTGPALTTQHGLDIGWSTTCDREYTVVVHINVVMFRGSFQCETPSRHVYTMNILHQTTCSAILVGFLHASNKKVYTLCEVDSSRR